MDILSMNGYEKISHEKHFRGYTNTLFTNKREVLKFGNGRIFHK